jgi:hypothetical protein
MTEFERALAAAREWEIALARWMRSRGWYVLPTYAFGGANNRKAPVLEAPPGARSLIMPDLQCFRDGRILWLEAKWKSEATLHRKTGTFVTGIALRHARHYERVQTVTGCGVLLAFVHEREREVRGGMLNEISDAWHHDYDGGVMGPGGMRFWRWDALPTITPLDEIARYRSSAPDEPLQLRPRHESRSSLAHGAYVSAPHHRAHVVDRTPEHVRDLCHRDEPLLALLERRDEREHG